MRWKNWRTSLAGIATMAFGVSSIANATTTGNNQGLSEGIAAILAGIGLLSAKDAQVTGGSVASTDEASSRIKYQ